MDGYYSKILGFQGPARENGSGPFAVRDAVDGPQSG